MPKMTTDTDRTRRGPNAPPSQAEIGPVIICPTVKAVVIHAPSSKPACTAPRTSARPNVVMRLSSVEMTAPKSTASTPMNGRAEMTGGACAETSSGWQRLCGGAAVRVRENSPTRRWAKCQAALILLPTWRPTWRPTRDCDRRGSISCRWLLSPTCQALKGRPARGRDRARSLRVCVAPLS
jgi:hypothetical protein